MGIWKAHIYYRRNEEHSQYLCWLVFYWFLSFKADLIRFMCWSVITVSGLWSSSRKLGSASLSLLSFSHRAGINYFSFFEIRENIFPSEKSAKSWKIEVDIFIMPPGIADWYALPQCPGLLVTGWLNIDLAIQTIAAHQICKMMTMKKKH